MADVPPAPFRLARGSAVAVVGLVLAVAAHASAGGSVVLPAETVLPAAAVLAGSVAAARRAWTVPRLLLALLAVQVVVHGTLWLSSGSGTVDPRLAGLVTAGAEHRHGSLAALTPGMLGTHALAVVVAAVLLAGVDEAVLRIWSVGRAVVAGGLTVSPVRTVDRLVAALPATPRGRTRALLVSPRRGPPARPAPC